MQRTSFPNVVRYPTSLSHPSLLLDGASGRLCDLYFFHPLRIALNMTLPILHLLRFPMPNIPYISNMALDAQMYLARLLMTIYPCLSSHSTYVFASKLFSFYVMASALQFDITTSLYSSCSSVADSTRVATRTFLAFFPSIPLRYGRMPSWYVVSLYLALDYISDHPQTVFLPFLNAFIRRPSLTISILQSKVIIAIHPIFYLRRCSIFLP
ncbi:uncharacterized protein EDB91DRAFT_680434 [Suillus paluster]|uniref:uncharacterized protein n=1 Tax=Suillus paluster TaxID=48578 RepID=UPI001B863535|nr:uncharacterized protein EDB91DRAFT_680434 [Suillus paluster]KAG1732261.1 hypothetical protein EDB91DRAFT_680434 [Suillus paluster]